jgi:hypothetical protein
MFSSTLKKIRLASLMLACTLGALGGISTTAVAQSTSTIGQSNISAYGEAGVLVPSVSKQFEDFYSRGSQFSVGVGYFVQPSLELHVRGSYARFRLDRGEVDELVPEIESTVNGESGTMWAGSVNLRYHSPVRDWLALRLNGGVGFYEHSLYGATLINNADESDTFQFRRQEQTSPGMNFGFGIAWTLTPRIRLAVNPEYTLVFGDRIEDERAFEQTGLFGFLSIQGGIDVHF